MTVEAIDMKHSDVWKLLNQNILDDGSNESDSVATLNYLQTEVSHRSYQITYCLLG